MRYKDVVQPQLHGDLKVDNWVELNMVSKT
jgi:hypothetical protein